MTYTSGDQNRILSHGLRAGLDRIGAGRADCGQYAAGADGPYRVGSIHPSTHQCQPLAARSPLGFDASHALGPNEFRTWPIPSIAQGVAFNDTTKPPGTWSWHYGRLEANGRISMTDANVYDRPGKGGMLSVFSADMQVTLGERGVQPIMRVPNIAGFVDYCASEYVMTGACFFFVYFG